MSDVNRGLGMWCFANAPIYQRRQVPILLRDASGSCAIHFHDTALRGPNETLISIPSSNSQKTHHGLYGQSKTLSTDLFRARTKLALVIAIHKGLGLCFSRRLAPQGNSPAFYMSEQEGARNPMWVWLILDLTNMPEA